MSSDFNTIAALCAAAEERGVSISKVVLEEQARAMELPAGELYERMRKNLEVMRQSVRAGMDPALRSTSGLSGGDAAKMQAYAAAGGITGSFLNGALARAIAVAEYNAAMGRIVAAPTAGSCGILPGTVVSLLEEGLCGEEDAVMALWPNRP